MSGKEGRHFADPGLAISQVVATLPVGFTLGELRTEGAITYQLKFNAGNSAINPGFCASPIPVFGGPHSMTVTTVSKAYNHFGAVIVHHATVPTANYFWGVRKGYLASGVAVDVTTATTGTALYIASDGKLNVMPQSVVTGNQAIAISLVGPTAGTVAVRQASVLVEFE